MKILQLELLAFGSFTHTILDFAQSQSGIHLIYGLNEAGKSTLRRALTHLLFGIPERTPDAHLHATDQLRIGAKLLSAQGEQLYCFRRKGRKNTLLDFESRPLEETSLQPFIGTINEAQFTALFCCDHERLRQGGENLLNGGGNVGESLFEAGIGTLRVNEVLAELDKEAGELFKARASKPKLNQTIRAYKEACQRIKDHSLSATKWAEHAEALEAARERHLQLTQELHTLRSEQRRLARIQRTRPLLQRQQKLREELEQLTSVILLPDEAASQRIETSLALHTAQAQEKQAQQAVIDLQQQLTQVVIPETLLAQKTEIDAFRTRLGSHQKAARDLPGVRTEMRTVESEAQTALRRIYPDVTLQEAHNLCVTNPQRERLRQLADNYPVLREKQASIQERFEKVSQQLLQQQAALDNLSEPPNLTELKAALNRALKQGDLEESLARDDKEVRLLTVKAEIGLKQLGLWTGSLDSLEQATLPTLERVDSFERRYKEVESDRQRTKERLLEARENDHRATKKLNALQWAGEVPTEDSLLKARQAREQRWQTLKLAQPTAEMYRVYEETVQKADEIADRLRREAQRVAEQASLLAEQYGARHEQEQQTKKWHKANELLAALQTEWEECWKPLGIKPWSPSEMRIWLTECLNLRQQASLLRDRRHQLATRQQLIADLCRELTQAFAQLPEGVIPLSRLTDLVEQAQATVAEIFHLERQRDDLDRQIKTLSLEQQKSETAKEQIGEALTSWQAEWTQAIIPLRLPATTLPEVARNVLDTLDQVLNKIDKAHGLRRRVERMDEDAAIFRRDVRHLVQLIAPEWMTMEVEEVIPNLVSRLSQAEKDLTRYEQLQQRLQVEQQRQGKAKATMEIAQARLSALLEQARCNDLMALELAEQASTHKKNSQRQLIEIEHQLSEQGEGLSLAELAQAAEAVDIDQLPEQLEHYEERIRQLEQERSELDRTIGEQRTLLKQMDGNAAAAHAADEAQQALAEMQELGERYIQVQLAATVLRKSIERYREQHQGPIIRRTSELFKRLTLGKFQGVKSGYNGQSDQPILLGLRTAESEGISTVNLSDGTRDQLYLALRLASIEHYLDKNPALPLILDDILINFDDERSRATLEVLSELSAKMQILFLTHHTRLVELAKSVIPSERLVVHWLQ